MVTQEHPTGKRLDVNHVGNSLKCGADMVPRVDIFGQPDGNSHSLYRTMEKELLSAMLKLEGAARNNPNPHGLLLIQIDHEGTSTCS